MRTVDDKRQVTRVAGSRMTLGVAVGSGTTVWVKARNKVMRGWKNEGQVQEAKQ